MYRGPDIIQGYRWIWSYKGSMGVKSLSLTKYHNIRKNYDLWQAEKASSDWQRVKHFLWGQVGETESGRLMCDCKTWPLWFASGFANPTTASMAPISAASCRPICMASMIIFIRRTLSLAAAVSRPLKRLVHIFFNFWKVCLNPCKFSSSANRWYQGAWVLPNVFH